MTLSAAILNHLTASLMGDASLNEEIPLVIDLTKRIPGWSGLQHYAFFRSVLRVFKPQRILICGVYHGRDLAFLQLAAKGHRPQITGVDLFSELPCADWPQEDRNKTWQQAQNSLPPDETVARTNCPDATILKGNSIAHLTTHAKEYDFIYLDTAHDHATIHAEITAVKASGFTGLLAGDDYQHAFGWGVVQAVTENFPYHIALFNRIWMQEL